MAAQSERAHIADLIVSYMRQFSPQSEVDGMDVPQRLNLPGTRGALANAERFARHRFRSLPSEQVRG